MVVFFGKIFWGGFWRVLAPKVAVSDLEVLKTLTIRVNKSEKIKKKNQIQIIKDEKNSILEKLQQVATKPLKKVIKLDRILQRF